MVLSNPSASKKDFSVRPVRKPNENNRDSQESKVAVIGPVDDGTFVEEETRNVPLEKIWFTRTWLSRSSHGVVSYKSR